MLVCAEQRFLENEYSCILHICGANRILFVTNMLNNQNNVQYFLIIRINGDCFTVENSYLIPDETLTQTKLLEI